MAEKTYEEWLGEMKKLKNYSDAYNLINAVPKELRTPELCLLAIKKDREDSTPAFLSFVPEETRTFEMCLAAVKKNSGSMSFVPENHKTRDLCLAYLKQTTKKKYSNNIYSLPVALWDDDSFCIEAIKANYWAIRVMPEDKRTAEIWLLVLSNMTPSATLLTEVPKKFWEDASFCVRAMVVVSLIGKTEHIFTTYVPKALQQQVVKEHNKAVSG